MVSAFQICQGRQHRNGASVRDAHGSGLPREAFRQPRAQPSGCPSRSLSSALRLCIVHVLQNRAMGAVPELRSRARDSSGFGAWRGPLSSLANLSHGASVLHAPVAGGERAPEPLVQSTSLLPVTRPLPSATPCREQPRSVPTHWGGPTAIPVAHPQSDEDRHQVYCHHNLQSTAHGWSHPVSSPPCRGPPALGMGDLKPGLNPTALGWSLVQPTMVTGPLSLPQRRLPHSPDLTSCRTLDLGSTTAEVAALPLYT